MPSYQERSAALDQQRFALKPAREMFKKVIDTPSCTGTVALNASQSLLFYQYKGEPKMIDFANPSESELEALADACSPASFGRNKEDVVDENYRKAGKMDPGDFAMQFWPWNFGLLRTAVETLSKTGGSTADLTVELYKLNKSYCPGSFFKAHVDTPRSDTMFGTHVVVLPTRHTGGSLLFRHHDVEHTFDSAHLVSVSPTDVPHAAFAAFFSDVEHEVAEVTSGYRVTVTYNLYHANPNPSRDPSDVTIESETQNLLTITTELASLLSNPDCLPDGGLLAFGLAYDYPFDYESAQPSDIAKRLKSIDALLKRACDELKLNASVKAVYYDPDGYYTPGEYAFVDSFAKFEYQDTDQYTVLEYICHSEPGVVIGYDALSGQPAPKEYLRKESTESPYTSELFRMNGSEYLYGADTEVLPVVWAKLLENKNEFKEKYISYGNEATLGCAYGQVCLLARMKPASERK